MVNQTRSLSIRELRTHDAHMERRRYKDARCGICTSHTEQSLGRATPTVSYESVPVREGIDETGSTAHSRSRQRVDGGDMGVFERFLEKTELALGDVEKNHGESKK